MVKYRRKSDGMEVDVEVIEESGHLYARMHNERAQFFIKEPEVCDCGEVIEEGLSFPTSPWCLPLGSFVERYEPVAPLPLLGGAKGLQ